MTPNLETSTPKPVREQPSVEKASQGEPSPVQAPDVSAPESVTSEVAALDITPDTHAKVLSFVGPVPPTTERALSRLGQVGQWMESLRSQPLDPPENLEAALEELNAAYEELRVAEEELLIQNEELQLAQIQIEAEREHYQTLFELAPDGYIATDVKGIIRDVNYTGGELLGIAPRFLVNKPLANYIAPENRQQFRTLLSELYGTNWLYFETMFQPRHGEPFPAVVTVSVGESAASLGKQKETVLRWLIRNVSEQERTARQLSQLNHVLHTLVQAAPLPIMVLDQNAQVTLWNPAATHLFGWTTDEVMGKPLPNVVAARQKEFETRHGESLGGKTHQGVETQRLRKDGSVVDVAIWTSPLRNPSGQVISSVWLIVDISEHKRYEETRRQLLERVVMAQEEERARISRDLHDHLGQYLTGIMLGLQALEANTEGLPHGDRRSNVEQLAKLRQVVDELMTVSHRQAWELRPAELDDMGLASAASHYVSDWATRNGITADFHAIGFEDKRLEGTVEITLYRVVQEALTNVLRHAQASRVDVVLELNINAATAIIEDNGRGFETSVEETLKKGRLGVTGMIERMALVGGTLEVESSSDAGTTVFARVPHPTIRTNDGNSPDTSEQNNP